MARHREPLPRLNISQPLHMQQPLALYSPALPTSLQQSFHPSQFAPMNNSLQTPMQSFFMPQPPPAPGRPTHQSRASIAHLSAAGIHPPNGFVTPVTGHFPRPSLMLGPGQPFGGQPPSASHPFPNRNRRQLSIGGPPKAVLGGPARKLSPLPTAASPAAGTPPGPPLTTQKAKKITVNLPKETLVEEEGEAGTRPSWARTPLPKELYEQQGVPLVESVSAEVFPPDEWRYHLPDSIDVFLPGKALWETLKQQVIEAKLERLGVERGTGSNQPVIHAPHARAASISSPADPALLLFKLNKLQQSQNASSAGTSLAASPQPPFGLSPSPHGLSRLFTNRHGHTMSLAQPPSYQPDLYNPSTSTFNPFAPSITSTDDGSVTSDAVEPSSGTVNTILAPQGRVPFTAATLAPPPLSAVGSNSRPDFIRGFGLDVTEETEEEEEEEQPQEEEAGHAGDTEDGDVIEDMELDEDAATSINGGGTTTTHSRLHSRHISKLSAALSLRSVGGNFSSILAEDDNIGPVIVRPTEDGPGQATSGIREDFEDVVAAGEWTGSEEEGYLGAETSDDESIGEWSNPSDEERARQQRVEKRTRRAMREQRDQPRRIPNFPRPPDNTLMFAPALRDEEIVSNPSEENLALGHRVAFLGVGPEEFFVNSPPKNMSGSLSPRLLPPLPHSRVTSGQFSAHDPAMAHSRVPSDQYSHSSHHQRGQQSHSSLSRRDSLNPFARPFVFGKPFESGSWEQPSGTSTPPNAPYVTHSRLPSLGKPLNVAAPEFKPRAFELPTPVDFTFRQLDAPQMPIVPPAFPHPEPAEPVEDALSSPFKVQGREKRQRIGSTDSIEEGNSMASFKFPAPADTPRSIRHTASLSGRLDPTAAPFSFEAFSNVVHFPQVARDSEITPEDVEEILSEAPPIEREQLDSEGDMQEFVFLASASKPKHAPIPLDFKHPVSGNTVPAGLFKALVNSGDDRSRRTVRSRLSSREIYEHNNRPSMDDLNVEKISRNRLATDPVKRSSSTGDDDVFGSTRHSRRRSSLPDALRDDLSSTSHSSVYPQDLTSRLEMHHLSDAIEQMLDEKFTLLRRDLAHKAQNTSQSLDPSSEAMIAEVVSLFRAQLQESAARGLEDSQMDARGDMDFQLVKDIIDEGHKEVLSIIHQQFQDIVKQNLDSRNHSQDILSIVEKVGQRTIDAVVESISELSARQEAIERVTPAHERDLLLDELVNVLSPMLRSEPIDYDFLTNQLTQAVKPHITQLIDLSSDKRETAGLIVDSLIPLLPSLKVDTDKITLQLVAEVRRAIAPIDAFEIKEQVADLVVERLDSRLAVRDKAFNVETVTSKIGESVSGLLEPLNRVSTTLDRLSATQQTLNDRHGDIVATNDKVLTAVHEIPTQLDSHFKVLHTAQAEVIERVEQAIALTSKADDGAPEIRSILQNLVTENGTLSRRNAELLTQQQAISSKVNVIPDTLSSSIGTLQSTISELITSRDVPKRDLDELRKLNTDYQIQLTKARAAHGQVRVEKDVLNEKLAAVEADRERFRVKANELEASSKAKVTETVTLEARNAELEDALAKALAGLQASDVATQTNQQRINELEKSTKEANAEKQALKSKVDSLELQVTFAARDKEAAALALEVLQKQHDTLASQQTHWDDLRQASEKIDMLTNLIGQADNDELKELRRYRDRTKPLENEHAALQKRVKEMETKVANSDRAALTARQSLAQAQQRSSEWERRAKDYEGQLEMTQTKLDQAEQTQSQLEDDHSLLKLQFEEREADDRLAKDCENKLRDQIAALESKAVRLQDELLKAKTTSRNPASRAPSMMGHSPSPYRTVTNGSNHPPPRPDSRATASTVNGRSAAADRRMSSYSPASGGSGTPPQPSVWDSMHAPTNDTTERPSRYNPSGNSIHAPASRYPHLGPSTPKVRRPSAYPQYSRANAPSPTPSTVSAAPTQGEDGWWA